MCYAHIKRRRASITQDSPLYVSSRSMISNLVSLIHSIKESRDAGISSVYLPKLLVPLINKILTAKNEQELINLKILSICKNRSAVIEYLKILYKLSENSDIKSFMCKIQKDLIWECLSDTKEQVEKLQQQQNLLQFRLSKNSTEQAHYDELRKELAKIKLVEIPLATKKAEEISMFCEKYKI